MVTCPLCKAELPDATPRCPRCQADLSLLSGFVTDLKALLDKADAHRRAGEVAPAVQAYLNALEIDPANAEARTALGPILVALRSIAPRSALHPAAWLVAGAGIATAAFAGGIWAARYIHF